MQCHATELKGFTLSCGQTVNSWRTLEETSIILSDCMVGVRLGAGSRFVLITRLTVTRAHPVLSYSEPTSSSPFHCGEGSLRYAVPTIRLLLGDLCCKKPHTVYNR